MINSGSTLATIGVKGEISQVHLVPIRCNGLKHEMATSYI